jgi:hypothetical protein
MASFARKRAIPGTVPNEKAFPESGTRCNHGNGSLGACIALAKDKNILVDEDRDSSRHRLQIV